MFDGHILERDAADCKDCLALKAKVDDLEKARDTLQRQISQLLDDKGSLLSDREKDKEEMERLSEKLAKLHADKSTENPKKRSK